jgi:endonuclease III
MGATISDTVLQAGLNYRNVVEPRVRKLIAEFPNARTTSDFQELLAFHGLKTLLRWNDSEKPRRIMEMTWFLSTEGLQTESMVCQWLQKPGNANLLLQLKGIGPKTVDYLKMLVGIPSIAVDRHIKNLVNNIGLQYKQYEDVQKVVGLAADYLGVDQNSFDWAIWSYLSTKQVWKAMPVSVS